jgi:hypothetical protein
MQAFKHPKRGAIIKKFLLYFPVKVSGVLSNGNLQYTSETFLERSREIILVIKAGSSPVSFERRCIPYAS